MEIEFESNSKEIINKCLDIISKPVHVIVDSRSTGYLRRRNLIDAKIEHKLLNSKVDDTDYYDELMKGF